MMSEIFERTGNPGEALKYYKKYNELKEKLKGEVAQREVNNLIRSYEVAEIARQDEIFMEKHQIQRKLLYLTIILFLLALILIGLLVHTSRLRLRLHKEKSKKLSEVVDKKNRELTSALLHNSQMRQVFEKAKLIANSLASGATKQDGLDHQLDELDKLMHSFDSSQEEWVTIQLHFSEVHPSFFSKLKENSAELTQYDLKHCAYIRMNLSTKEIGRILNISERSVQTARYRIKKKLNLLPQEDLTDFIHRI
jgi:preprotein translocase subunit SecY